MSEQVFKLKTTFEVRGEVSIIRFGKLLTPNIPLDFGKEFKRLIYELPMYVIFDFSNTDLISEVGDFLGICLRSKKRICLASVSNQNLEILQLLGFTAWFYTYTDVEEALATYSKQKLNKEEIWRSM